MINRQELLEAALEIATEAGAAIMQVYGREFAVELKDDRSPLTEADRAAHRIIVAGLGRLSPRLPVLSEESAAHELEDRRQWDPFWLVDPLDGTKEFIKRNGEFTVNIALIRGHDAVLGVVHVPARDEDYYGCRDHGAFLKRANNAPKAINATTRAASPVRVVGSRSHRGASLETFLERVGPHEMVPMGSSLKLCLVASGDADVYPRLGPTSEWDTAAAQAVVECAGGRVVNLAGEPIRYNAKADILNPFFLVYADPERDWLACAAGA
jgi:3'(2'), 5'-bisphosphate nucleotidase